MAVVADDKALGVDVIFDSILAFCTATLGWLSGLLPPATITLPSTTDVSAWFGTYAAPFDKIIPLYEATIFATLLLTVWLPSAGIYTIVVWAYKHMPVFGKG